MVESKPIHAFLTDDFHTWYKDREILSCQIDCAISTECITKVRARPQSEMLGLTR